MVFCKPNKILFWLFGQHQIHKTDLSKVKNFCNPFIKIESQENSIMT
jgi:hypothetical protein